MLGHRPLMLTAVSIFATGSGISGGATTWMMLLAGRIIQGIGGAGINLLSQLIVNHLVPLRDRGKYMSFIYAAFMVGTGLGPFLGGALVEKVSWRWVFYINLPIALTALVSLYVFLPPPSFQTHKLQRTWRRIDYIGNILIVAAVTSMLVGLSFGGESFNWLSWQVVLPLALGVCGLLVFFVYEASPMGIAVPILPPRILADNRTTTVGLILSFMQFLISYWILYFLPVYFQGVLGSSPERSGVLLLPSVLFSVFASVVFGIILTKTGRFKHIHILATFLLTVGLLLFMKLDADSTLSELVISQSLAAVGFGSLMSTVLPAVQAGVSNADAAVSTAAWGLIRAMGGVWGLAIPSTIFNSRFQSLLEERVADQQVIEALGNGAAYASISSSYISHLSDQIRVDVIGIYVDALQRVWLGGALLGIFALALSVFERDISLLDRDLSDEKV